jgi:predicted transcriptional regulator
MPYVKRTTVYLPEALKARLSRAARDRNVSEAELVRAAIDEYTRTDARPRPTLPLFESIGDPDLAERVDEILAEGFGRD